MSVHEEIHTVRVQKRESMEDFKQKLFRLEKNKSDLESKMREFESKLKNYSTSASTHKV